MNEKNNSSDSTSNKINAIANLTKEVPIYNDLAQPIAKETGKALGTIRKAINAMLTPLKGLVWGIEQIEIFMRMKLEKDLKKYLKTMCAHVALEYANHNAA
jgi:hypothetical protein